MLGYWTLADCHLPPVGLDLCVPFRLLVRRRLMFGLPSRGDCPACSLPVRASACMTSHVCFLDHTWIYIPPNTLVFICLDIGFWPTGVGLRAPSVRLCGGIRYLDYRVEVVVMHRVFPSVRAHTERLTHVSWTRHEYPTQRPISSLRQRVLRHCRPDVILVG